MGPRYLQSQIHTDYATGSNVWSEYRSQIKSMYDSSSNKEDFNDHLIREYNRKIERLNQQTGLYIAPFDGGFRFIGDSIASVGGIVGFAYPNETLTAPSGSSYLWTVNGTSRGTNQTFVPTVNDIGEVVTCLVGGATTYTTTVWHPRDISSVQAFWWAAKNAYNFIGNNYTDANRPVVYNDSITLTLVSIGNYSGSSGENTYFIFKDETYWVLEIYNVGGEEPSLQQTVYSTNDDAQYPWQSTWPSGTTITPIATTTDTLATDGQTVPVWGDIISNQRATASSSNIALKENTDLGGPSLKFDSTDFYTLPFSARAIYNSKRWGYIFVGAKDSNPSEGDTNHGLVSINRTTTATKIGLRTRDSSSNVFSARTNPNTFFPNDIVVSSSASNNSNYNVLTNESLWDAGRLALRINGVEDNFDDSFGGGNFSSSLSFISYIGATTSTTANFNGDITAVILASNIGESDEMSAVDRFRIERFIGLLGGLDIRTELFNGLRAYWKLDETSGTRVDSHGSLDLTPSSSDESVVNYIAGILGDAADFNNSTFLTSTDIIPLVGRSSSFSFWVKSTINTSFYDYPNYVLIVISDSPSCYITADGHIGAHASPGGNAEECRLRSVAQINDGEWHHVVVIGDGNIQKLYIDGVLDTTGGSNPPDGSYEVSPIIIDQSGTFETINTLPVLINAFDPTTIYDFGTSPVSIDEIGVWNRELTEQEIIALYNNGDGLPYEQF